MARAEKSLFTERFIACLTPTLPRVGACRAFDRHKTNHFRIAAHNIRYCRPVSHLRSTTLRFLRYSARRKRRSVTVPDLPVPATCGLRTTRKYSGRAHQRRKHHAGFYNGRRNFGGWGLLEDLLACKRYGATFWLSTPQSEVTYMVSL